MAPEVKQPQEAPVESSKPSLDNVINTALTDKKLTSKERENISQKYQEYLEWKADIKDETKNSLKQFLTNSKWSANFEKFKKVMLTKLDSKPTVAPANAAPAAWKDTAPANAANAAPAAPESTEASKVTYKLESADVIKTAIANLDHNSVSINQEQIIGSYVDSEWKEQKIVLKWSSTNLRVELDWSWTLDDTDLPVEKSDFESIKKVVTTLIEQYKKEVSSKKWDKAPDKKWAKLPDVKGEKVQDAVNENEKKVRGLLKLVKDDWKFEFLRKIIV